MSLRRRRAQGRGRRRGTPWVLVAALLAAALAALGAPVPSADAQADARAGSLVHPRGSAPPLAVDPATVPGPVVGAAVAAGDGLWLVTATGAVVPAGAAPALGDLRDLPLNQPIVAMAPTPTGDGYWLAARDGGVFTFGDATFHGSLGAIPLNQPIVAMAPTPTGDGYWLAARDGGVFTFGDAAFHGSAAAEPLAAPVVAMGATGVGYLLATEAGDVHAFGEAVAHPPPDGGAEVRPVAALAVVPSGGGYWLVQAHAGGATLPGGATRFFPEHRVVALYGTAGIPAMGVLGEGTPEQAAERLLDVAAPYRTPDRRLLPSFELIVTIAQRSPGPDGDYSYVIPLEDVRRYLEAVRRIGGVLVLDLQPGQGDFLSQARLFEEVLTEPDVGLALDPEWHLPRGVVPGTAIGSVTAEEINAVGSWLAELTARHALPQKLFVIHRFTPEMVRGADRVAAHPELATVFHADGFGSPANKIGDYDGLLPDRFARGFKLFYDEDRPLMSPEAVLRLVPPPDLVTYQ